MLNRIATALVAATVLSAPLIVAGTTASSAATNAATTEAATPAKPAVKAVKKHRSHARHMARHGTRYVKIVRHGKVTFVKVKAGRHHVQHANKPGKQPVQQGTAGNKPRAS